MTPRVFLCGRGLFLGVGSVAVPGTAGPGTRQVAVQFVWLFCFFSL